MLEEIVANYSAAIFLIVIYLRIKYQLLNNSQSNSFNLIFKKEDMTSWFFPLLSSHYACHY